VRDGCGSVAQDRHRTRNDPVKAIDELNMRSSLLFSISARGIAIAAALWCALLSGRDARAVVFEFIYTDPGGTGFTDPIFGPQRRAALEHAGAIWGSLIPSAYAGEVITVGASYADFDGNSFAAASSPYLYPAPTRPVTHFPKALANHLSGFDVDPDKDEITIKFNSDYPDSAWYYGLDGNPGSMQYDYVSTALHEIGHGLGFDGTFRADGGYASFGDRRYDPDEEISGWPIIYDWFVTRGPNGTLLFDLPRDQRAAALAGDNLYWSGTQATAAQGSPVQLYAPLTYDDGSTLSHVDDAFSTALMRPAASLGEAGHTPLDFERAMLRDMGWNIAVAPANLAWSGLGADNSWTTATNWVGAAIPRGGDSISFGPSPQTDVAVLYDGESFGQQYLFLNTLNFAADASVYTLRFKPRTNTRFSGTAAGTGIINFSSQTHQIILESSFRDGLWVPPLAAKMTFSGGAIAGNSDYLLRGGGTTIAGGPPPHIPHYFEHQPGASITFENNSSAGTASFVIEGGAGDGGPNAQVTFRNDANAGAAEFRTKGGLLGPSLPLGSVAVGFGGQILFEDVAKAGGATLHNEGQAEYFNGAGGFTLFTDSSTADNSEIHNHGATYTNGFGGATYFYNSSTAGAARIFNHADGSNFGSTTGARTAFQDSSNAGTAIIENEGAPSQAARHGRTEFRNNASAASATINNRGYKDVGDLAGRTLFYDDSTAAGATLRTFNGYSDYGRIEFRDRSTAADARIFLDNDPMVTASRGGYLLFYNNATAARSEITLRTGNSGGGGLQFFDRATAGDAQIVAENNGGPITFWGISSAGDPPESPTPQWASFSLGQGNVMSFWDQSTAADAHFTLADRAQMLFQANSSAGEATIIASGGSVYTASTGTTVTFNSNSTADRATITAQGATAPLASPAAVWFINGSHAGHATITANGGSGGGAGATVTFTSSAQGDTARLIANAGGTFDFNQVSYGGVTSVGAIEGAGTFYLRGTELTVGARNIDTIVTGQIVDTLVFPTYTGGRLTKVGTGTLTLAGENTYTGLTTVAGGTLRVDGAIAGDVLVRSGARLEGGGRIPRMPEVEAGGAFAPGTSPGTITVGGLTMRIGSILEFEVGQTARDRIVVTGNGDISLAGTLTIVPLADAPTLGQSFSVFEGAVGNITGSFDTVIAPTFNGLTLNVTQTGGSVMLQVATDTSEKIWGVDAGGVVSAGANWQGGMPPLGANDAAAFTSAISADRSVQIDAPLNLRSVRFDDNNDYTLQGETLTLQAHGAATAVIQVRNLQGNGAHSIAAPIVVASDLDIVQQSTGALTLSGALNNSAGRTITKSGPGTMSIEGAQAHGAGAVLTVSAGVVNMNTNAGSNSAPNLTVNANSTTNFGSTQHLAALNVGAGATATLTAGGTKNLVTGALTIAGGSSPTGRLDLTNNAAIVDYAGTSPAATLRAQILAGRGGAGFGATWTGMGITSSAAAADSPLLRSLGFAENSALPLGPYTTFRGQPVDDTSLLIAFTRTGDANLDGFVNDDDVTIVGATYAPGVAQASWALGDFDYNGFVDDDDVTLLGAFYDPSAAPLAVAVPTGVNVAAVPEPASALLVATALLGLGIFPLIRRAKSVDARLY
jgi:autotransporter-associated beta strand protein